jgi:hypothetical protein
MLEVQLIALKMGLGENMVNGTRGAKVKVLF